MSSNGYDAIVNEEREELATVIRSLSVENPIDGMKQLTSDCCAAAILLRPAALIVLRTAD